MQRTMMVQALLVTLTLVSLGGTTARAQNANDIGDTVYLKKGGRVRGTVLEDDPQAGIQLRVPDGTVRKFTSHELDHVDYAPTRPPPTAAGNEPPPTAAPGEPAPPPAAGDEPAPPPPNAAGTGEPASHPNSPTTPPSAPPPPPNIRFEQQSHELGRLKLYVMTGFIYTGRPTARTETVGQYDEVCLAPCVTPLRPGSYRFAIGFEDDASFVPLDDTYAVQVNQTLLANLRSRATVRTAGVVLGSAGLTAAIIGGVVGMNYASDARAQGMTSANVAAIVALSLGLTAVIVGAIMLTLPDAPELRIVQ
jgi:hypothetical protein